MTRLILITVLLSISALQSADEKQETGSRDKTEKRQADPFSNEGLRRLAKDHDVWVDMKKKQVVVDGEVCLRNGQLEMFACPKHTKEHESVVALNSPASFVHAGLLAVGAKPGKTVRFEPEYSPAKGTIVDVYVWWKDKDGKPHRVRAQEWIKQLKTGKTMPYDWVFAGSGFYQDESTGERWYYADGGELICVSNFTTAMLDLPVPSSADASGLLFAAYEEKIPPLRTKIRVILAPRLPKPDGKQDKEPSANRQPATKRPDGADKRDG